MTIAENFLFVSKLHIWSCLVIINLVSAQMSCCIFMQKQEKGQRSNITHAVDMRRNLERKRTKGLLWKGQCEKETEGTHGGIALEELLW